MRRNILAMAMVVILLVHSVYLIYGATDSSVLSEPVSGIYTARATGNNIINNLRFADLQASHWAKEPITRLGALEIIKGDSNGRYRPNSSVSKEEALALLVRMIGREEDAIRAAQQLDAGNETNESLNTIWSRGYMNIANKIGLITAAEYRDAISEDQGTLDPTSSFIRQNPVTREQIAKWIVQAVGTIKPEQLSPVYTQQAIFNYTDWNNMDAQYTPYIEAVTIGKIMVGSGGRFQPKSSLTRAELAQVLKNMDKILYETMTIEQKGGFVGAITDTNVIDPITGTAIRSFLIRNNEGGVDQLDYEYKKNATNQIATKDAPVYQNGAVNSMLSLKEGEAIEYLVDQETNELLYVYSKGNPSPEKVTGILQPVTDLDKGQITIKTTAGALFTYSLSGSLYDAVNNTVNINGIVYTPEKAPVSSSVKLTLVNSIVTEISLLGTETVYSEVSGIVKDNNTAFSYITIIDWNGNEVTKNYRKTSVEVEKQNYYDESDEIGYIDQMFPDYRFDEKDSGVEEIEVGDIVHMRIDPTNKDYVAAISAKTNYVVKYGTVKDISYKGAEGANIIITYDDLSIDTFAIPSTLPVLKSGKNVGLLNLLPGDVVRMLVNQAVIEPGNVRESVKELIIDQYGNEVANVYKGEMGTINKQQRKVTLNSTYELTSLGWGSYAPAKSLDISAANVEYFQGGKQISLEYAEKYLTQDSIEVYVVTSQYYGTEKVEKITFREGRDSVLSPSNVTYSNGQDKMKLLSESGTIAMDSGTIVIKNGKLVQAGNVIAPDYAQVILNGGSSAAIVNIEPEPNNDAVSVFRGRIQGIKKGESFQVQSHSVLMDTEWIYSPIPRIYNITRNTQIYDEDGFVSFDDFIDYSDISKVDEVYTIIAEGTNASYVVKNPYATEGVKGQIYEVEDGSIMIKDALVYSSTTNKWSNLSLKNNYAEINTFINSVIIKNNKVIEVDDLKIGDNIKIMTTEDLSKKLLLTSERDVDGYIIFVE
ncbi:MAG: hypothetical protein CVV02_00300 [Firmicutes bacterium HGW-Firmicutes-7]|nr:MAG: hypothetical protein CVV02_00300 [Firmicutes bacterium HGW-Firmicutes-7]